MGARRLTFGALPTGCGPVGRLRPGSLPGRGGSLHGQPSRLEEARRNPSSQLATEERRGEEKRKIASSWGPGRGGDRWCLVSYGGWALGLEPDSVLAQLQASDSWALWFLGFQSPSRLQFRRKFPI